MSKCGSWTVPACHKGPFFEKIKKIKKLKVFHAKLFFQVAFWDNIFAKITVRKKL